MNIALLGRLLRGIFISWSVIVPALAAETGSAPFEGASTPLPGYSYGKPREEFFKYKDEKPLLTITAANVKDYADKLAPGELEMIKARPGYQMNIFPTHRDCVVPDFVKKNSEANVTAAKLDSTGAFLETAVLPGAPFPNPKNGAEAMWNFLVRYQGVGFIYPKIVTATSPAPGSKTWITATQEPWTMYFPWGRRGQNTPTQVNGKYFYIYYLYSEPTAFAGEGVSQIYYFSNQPVETFFYFPGQRRVRRLPAYTYDTPQIGYENNYTVDDTYLFSGPIDRYDWTIVGTKDLYVPYNNFGMYRFDKPYHDVMKDDVINPANRRYELHTVIEVRGKVKATARHISETRVLYLDPDSWNAVAGEDYDGQGKLWKAREGFVIPVWELGSACDAPAFVDYNITNGRYVHDGGITGQGKDIQWFLDAGDKPFFTADYYSAAALQQRSER